MQIFSKNIQGKLCIYLVTVFGENQIHVLWAVSHVFQCQHPILYPSYVSLSMLLWIKLKFWLCRSQGENSDWILCDFRTPNLRFFHWDSPEIHPDLLFLKFFSKIFLSFATELENPLYLAHLKELLPSGLMKNCLKT